MPLPPNIDSLSVWLDKPAVQQAFVNLAAPIIQAAAMAETHGKRAARAAYGENGKSLPVSGEVVIGRIRGHIVKMEIEPDTSGWAGDHLTHEEIQALGISDMVVDGKSLKHKES